MNRYYVTIKLVNPDDDVPWYWRYFTEAENEEMATAKTLEHHNAHVGTVPYGRQANVDDVAEVLQATSDVNRVCLWSGTAAA